MITKLVSPSFFQGNESLFSLSGQTEHKISFVKEHVPPDCDLTLIGHSVGCKIVMDVMEHFRMEEPNRKIRSQMLFPMMQKMYQTPNGPMCWFQVRFNEAESLRSHINYSS